MYKAVLKAQEPADSAVREVTLNIDVRTKRAAKQDVEKAITLLQPLAPFVLETLGKQD